MHLLVRKTVSLDEQAQAEDLAESLGHTPADIVFLSFSNSDLAALASCLKSRFTGSAPRVNLVPLERLRHPLSVDLYLESVVAGSRCVLVRLLGGVRAWAYGAEELCALCRRRGIPLAFLNADGRTDTQMEAMSSISATHLERLNLFFEHGGPENLAAALRLAHHLGGGAPDTCERPSPVEVAGVYTPPGLPQMARGHEAAIVFYRSHLLAHDTAAVDRLAHALCERDITPHVLYVSSLKDPVSAAFVQEYFHNHPPGVILNATFFSSSEGEGGMGVLGAAGVPVLQLFMAANTHELWQKSFRGLSQRDVAMQVVLPELDGYLPGTVVSFRQEHNGIQRSVCFENGINMVAERALGWLELARTPRAERRLAIILSDYPGAAPSVHDDTGLRGHAVGLDSFASLAAIVGLLSEEGYDSAHSTAPGPEEFVSALCHESRPTAFMSLERYAELCSALPRPLYERIHSRWGPPEQDASFCDGSFYACFMTCGKLTIAIQPPRAAQTLHKALYHDPDAPPTHGFTAFYLWLRHELQIHALIHLGTHGTLEWLPSKAVAPSESCYPLALAGGTPVVYPFIVNNPGESAVARRRLGAVTISHMTPPISRALLHGHAARLERLIDEYAETDGMDKRRGEILRTEILSLAEATGLLTESGAARHRDADEALARLDAYLCDVKDLQIRDGLHIFGTPHKHREKLLKTLLEHPGASQADITGRLDASPPAERRALVETLDGKFLPSGPAGAPTRGRLDALPTGRNLFTVDPRIIPTQSAMVIAEKTAQNLLVRHLQEHGTPLRHMIMNIWGSTTLRTGGEDLALAFILMGVTPLRNDMNGRVTGFEIVPLPLLDRPRVDITLRISGMFRDTFENLVTLFDQVVRSLAAQDEPYDYNTLVKEPDLCRIYGSAPGAYGTGLEGLASAAANQTRNTLGHEWIAGSAFTYGGGQTRFNPEGLAARLQAAQALLHHQDQAETDILESPDYSAHEGGMMAAASALGGAPAFYHTDTSHIQNPRVRLLMEEIARVTRGRAANPDWIAAMMRHGYRGAAEMARTVDALFGFALTLPQRLDQQFDLVFDAMVADEKVSGFLKTANPAAYRSIHARLREAHRRALWHPRANHATSLLTESGAQP